MSFQGSVSFKGDRLRRLADEARSEVAKFILIPWAEQVGTWRHQAWEGMTYSRLDGGPASFMGTATWVPSPAQYTRKTDGVRVPAFGGVPRVRRGTNRLGERMKRVSGNVSGRRRASGKRVARTSIMMADTGRMRREFTRRYTLANSGLSIALTTNVEYAATQNRMRPFNVPSERDRNLLRSLGHRFMARLAR
jgi:hypothetical protein